jgi:uncharacterized protein
LPLFLFDMSQIKYYRAFSEELKQIFGCKVQRISVDAGFTCPNRDGSLDSAGCLFCGGKGSGSFGIKPMLSVAEQLEDGKEVMLRKYRARKFIAYFQAYSNTYAPLDRLCQVYSEALAVNDVVGLIIATRPDCLSDDILDYLMELHNRSYLWLEIGVQSIHNKSLEFLKRGHDYACTIDAIRRAKQRGLRVCAHIILGIPGETTEEMLASAEELNRLGVDGVKLHLLHVMKGTELEQLYHQGGISLLDRDSYAGLVCDYLERLKPDITVHRLTGDGGHDNLVAPLWSLKKFEVLNLIDSVLKERGSCQGSLLANR